MELSISVVSHRQIGMVEQLLQDIQAHCKNISLEVILTLNMEEMLPFDTTSWEFPIIVIRNTKPKGFGANHNQAFNMANGRYFCVINPDIRFHANPFHPLLECLSNEKVAIAAPVVLGINGDMEDSARRFPSPLRIICKAFGKCKKGDYEVGTTPIHPDWVGGMLMMLRREAYRALGGFDERYFLYYEDVDLCARARLLKQEIVLCPSSRVVHKARRSSHHSLKYFVWHLGSMLRFFLSPVYCQLLLLKFQDKSC